MNSTASFEYAAAGRQALSKLLERRREFGFVSQQSWTNMSEGRCPVVILEAVGTDAGTITEAISRRSGPVVVACPGRCDGWESSDEVAALLDAAAFAVILSPGDAPFGRSELRCVDLCHRRDLGGIFVLVDAVEPLDSLVDWAPRAARRAGLDAAAASWLLGGALVVVAQDVAEPKRSELVAGEVGARLQAVFQRRVQRVLGEIQDSTIAELDCRKQFWMAKVRRIERVTAQLQLVEDHLRIQADMMLTAIRRAIEDLPLRGAADPGRRAAKVEVQKKIESTCRALVETFEMGLSAEAARFARIFPEFDAPPDTPAAEWFPAFLAVLNPGIRKLACEFREGCGWTRLMARFEAVVVPHLIQSPRQLITSYVGRVMARGAELTREAVEAAQECEAMRALIVEDRRRVGRTESAGA